MSSGLHVQVVESRAQHSHGTARTGPDPSRSDRLPDLQRALRVRISCRSAPVRRSFGEINALTTELAAFAASALVGLKATDITSSRAEVQIEVTVSNCQYGRLQAQWQALAASSGPPSRLPEVVLSQAKPNADMTSAAIGIGGSIRPSRIQVGSWEA